MGYDFWCEHLHGEVVRDEDVALGLIIVGIVVYFVWGMKNQYSLYVTSSESEIKLTDGVIGLVSLATWFDFK